MKTNVDRNAYKLDYIAESGIPALTEKNTIFIEAVVRLDSNYSRDTGIYPPKGTYRGSIPYWFDQIEREEGDYFDNLKNAMLAINASNSTRASIEDIEVIAQRVFNSFSNKNSLIAALNKTFTEDDHDHIFAILLKKDGNTRYELSFASKFCAYASIHLKTAFQYAKYDKIVSENLYKYIHYYLQEDVNINRFILRGETRSDNEEAQYRKRLKIYFDYNSYIDRLLEKAKEGYSDITKENIDHIIWYGLKNETISI